MAEQLISNIHGETDRVDDEVHLLDLFVVIAQHKALVIGAPILAGALALGASMLMTPLFSSTAKILPPQAQQSSGVAAMLGQLGGLAGAAGGLSGMKNPNDVYAGLLESRNIRDKLINRFKLRERYGQGMDDTRATLASVSTFSSGKKDGIISIEVTDKDPQFAADMANVYVEELSRLTQTMALTEASQRRLFFEKQLSTAKDQLANAEVALRTTQEKTGLIQPEAQVQAIMTNAAQLKGTIAAKEVQINAMRTFAAGQNPELLRAQEELRGLKLQLGKLERGQSTADGGFMVPTGKLPGAGVEYVRALRTMKYYETIFELLAKQFELAKIDEAKDSTLIQVLDSAIPAEHKIKPRRALITLGGVLFGAVLGIFLAFCHAGYQRSRQHPDSSRRWIQLANEVKRTRK